MFSRSRGRYSLLHSVPRVPKLPTDAESESGLLCEPGTNGHYQSASTNLRRVSQAKSTVENRLKESNRDASTNKSYASGGRDGGAHSPAHRRAFPGEADDVINGAKNKQEMRPLMWKNKMIEAEIARLKAAVACFKYGLPKEDDMEVCGG
jgi:hypothetical protein